MTAISWIPFRWEGAQLGEHYFPHAAMFVPGSLPTLDGLKGWFQFDLGAPATVLYGGAFSPAQRARVEDHPRRPEPRVFNGQEVLALHLPVQVGPWEIGQVVYLQDFGDGDLMEDGQPILGTIGSDLVREHVLMMDFPNQRLTRLDALPASWEAQIRWVPLRLSARGHVILQIMVDGAPRWAMYDSGSSLFQLITDPVQWQQFATGAVTETFPITAWGERLEVHGGPARAAFALGDQLLPVSVVHYLEGDEQRRFLEENDLIGLMGNEPFVEHVLVFDFPNKRAGVLTAV